MAEAAARENHDIAEADFEGASEATGGREAETADACEVHRESCELQSENQLVRRSDSLPDSSSPATNSTPTGDYVNMARELFT